MSKRWKDIGSRRRDCTSRKWPAAAAALIRQSCSKFSPYSSFGKLVLFIDLRGKLKVVSTRTIIESTVGYYVLLVPLLSGRLKFPQYARSRNGHYRWTEGVGGVVQYLSRSNRVCWTWNQPARALTSCKNVSNVSVQNQLQVLESAYRLNLFPAKGGVSSYYSPQVILHRTVIKYSKHCAIPFGADVHECTSKQQRRSPRRKL